MIERHTGPTLVVGGTGILRPAVHMLCASGRNVAAVSRYPEHLEALRHELANANLPGNLIGIRADYTHLRLFSRSLQQAIKEHSPFESGILYCRDAVHTTLPAVASVVEGRLVVVLTSIFGAPGRPEGIRGYPGISDVYASRLCFLLLGWHTEGGRSRWHTATEISRAATACLSSGRDACLGVIRPWTERPQ